LRWHTLNPPGHPDGPRWSCGCCGALAIVAVAAAGLKARPSIDATPKEAVMRVVALISWIVTALAGATLFGI
jgi:hypothetical protein